MLYSLIAANLHESLGSPYGLSAVVAVLASYIFLTSLALWVIKDARRRGVELPYDYGSFVFFGWILVVPVYLWWTRRWRALIPVGAFALLYGIGMLVSNIPRWY